MGIILKSHLAKFCDNYELTTDSISDAEKFELFTGYSVASKFYTSETITKTLLQEIHTGDGDDWGIDNFIVIVNGKIVVSIDEVEELYNLNKFLEVQFILVQAKTSTTISSAEFGLILDGAKYVFQGIDYKQIRPKHNDKIKEYCEIVEYIYEKSADFKNGENPTLTIYYIYQGCYQKVEEVEAKRRLNETELNQLNLFSHINYDIFGENEIIDLYKKSLTRLEATLTIGNDKILLPDVDGVSEGYICLVPFKEFRKLILDNDGKINRVVFEDNVRDYQGDNQVNKSMEESIRNGEIALFTMMNNGITVIAKTVKFSRQNVHLIDYQIVNGCQTSHVLQKFTNPSIIDELKLLVKIIGSEDKVIRDKIIVGNNSQTEVKREQLVSLLDSHKKIEEYYLAQNLYEKLYYERRSKQYRNDPSVPNAKIITVAKQIQSFIAMIIGEPHKIRGYYGSIIQDFQKQDRELIDTKKHHPSLYYTSGLAWYKLNNLFDLNKINKAYGKIKFHLLYAFRLLSEPNSLPTKSTKVEEYCNTICSQLSDSSKCEAVFLEAVNVIYHILNRLPSDNDRFSESLTKSILSNIKKTKFNQSEKSSNNSFMYNTSNKSINLKIIGKIDLDKIDERKRFK